MQGYLLQNIDCGYLLEPPQRVHCTHNLLVGEPKSRILQNDKKIAPDFDMAEFLYIGRLNSA